MPSVNPGPASSSTVNSFEIASQVPNPPGDQSQISRDTSILREGSTSQALSGDLFTLVGDQVMKYWTHNFGIDQNGFFLGRDDSGPCSLIVITEGLGILASTYAMYSTAGLAVAGSPPGTFTKVYSIDLTTGLVTLGSATLLATNIALTNNAAAATATLTNSPTAGNPTKWIPINDNGTVRNIPAW